MSKLAKMLNIKDWVIWFQFRFLVKLLQWLKILDFNNVKILNICCTDKVALFLSSNKNILFIILDEGTLYVWGDDSENKYGLLGLG